MNDRPADAVSDPFAFCPGCGRPGGTFARQHEYHCPACGFRYFHSVATAVGTLLEHQGRVLFIERAKDPAKGKLGLPGGFVDPGESAEVAVAREIREEVGGEIGPPLLLASFPNRYDFARTWYHTCDFYYRAELLTPPDDLVIDPGEVTRLVWLRPEDVNPDELAFPSLKAFWKFVRG